VAVLEAAVRSPDVPSFPIPQEMAAQLGETEPNQVQTLRSEFGWNRGILSHPESSNAFRGVFFAPK